LKCLPDLLTDDMDADSGATQLPEAGWFPDPNPAG